MDKSVKHITVNDKQLKVKEIAEKDSHPHRDGRVKPNKHKKTDEDRNNHKPRRNDRPIDRQRRDETQGRHQDDDHKGHRDDRQFNGRRQDDHKGRRDDYRDSRRDGSYDNHKGKPRYQDSDRRDNRQDRRQDDHKGRRDDRRQGDDRRDDRRDDRQPRYRQNDDRQPRYRQNDDRQPRRQDRRQNDDRRDDSYDGHQPHRENYRNKKDNYQDDRRNNYRRNDNQRDNYRRDNYQKDEYQDDRKGRRDNRQDRRQDDHKGRRDDYRDSRRDGSYDRKGRRQDDDRGKDNYQKDGDQPRRNKFKRGDKSKRLTCVNEVQVGSTDLTNIPDDKKTLDYLQELYEAGELAHLRLSNRVHDGCYKPATCTWGKLCTFINDHDPGDDDPVFPIKLLFTAGGTKRTIFCEAYKNNLIDSKKYPECTLGDVKCHMIHGSIMKVSISCHEPGCTSCEKLHTHELESKEKVAFERLAFLTAVKADESRRGDVNYIAMECLDNIKICTEHIYSDNRLENLITLTCPSFHLTAEDRTKWNEGKDKFGKDYGATVCVDHLHSECKIVKRSLYHGFHPSVDTLKKFAVAKLRSKYVEGMKLSTNGANLVYKRNGKVIDTNYLTLTDSSDFEEEEDEEDDETDETETEDEKEEDEAEKKD